MIRCVLRRLVLKNIISVRVGQYKNVAERFWLNNKPPHLILRRLNRVKRLKSRQLCVFFASNVAKLWMRDDQNAFIFASLCAFILITHAKLTGGKQ